MMSLLLQLPLSVQLQDEATFANYFPGSNRTLLGFLRQENHPEHIPLEKFIYIYGASGVGCTHLLQAACHEAHGMDKRSIYLPMDEFIFHSPKLLEGMESLDLICIDNIFELAGNSRWEEAVFHLFNRVRDNGKRLLIAGNNAPTQLPINLRDLTSRLTWGIVMQINSLNDDEKIQLLCLRARLRGLDLSYDVARYILTHSSRGLHDLFEILNDLDTASLLAKRKLSLCFVKEVMQRQHQCYR